MAEIWFTDTKVQGAILLLLLLLRTVVAQQCYYPNGKPSVEPDAPCNASNGPSGNCCPLNWECLSNGLCSNPNANLMQRTTCTDNAWGSSCPNICTYGDTAAGNEAILKCANGQYCCDKNRVDYDCCNDPNGISFNLQDGSQVAFISSVNTAGTSALPPFPTQTVTAQGSQTSIQAAQPSTPSASIVSAPLVTPSVPIASSFSVFPSNSPTSIISAQSSTSVFTSTSAGSVVVVTSVVSETPQPQDTSSTSPTGSPLPHTNTGAIVGGVVGGVCGLLLLVALAALLLWRRRRSKRQRDEAAAAAFNPTYADEDGGETKRTEPPGPHEVDGTGVGYQGGVAGKSEMSDTSPQPPSYSPATTYSQGLSNSPNTPSSAGLVREPYELHGGSMRRSELPDRQYR